MQIKALLLSAVAVATVSAQSFEVNACTTCVFGSFPKAPGCTTLTPAQTSSIISNFATGTVNVTGLAAATQDPALKACICSWATTAFTATGAASDCTAGASPVCVASQVAQAAAGITQLTPILRCTPGNATSSTGSSTGTATGAAPTPSKTSAANMNAPYVAMVAALGLVALVGF